MKKPWTPIIARILTIALVFGAVFSVGTLTASAASNKALRMKVSFDGKDTGDGKDNATIWNNNTYSSFACYQNASKISNKIRICGTVYLPKKALSKAYSSIHIAPYLDVTTNTDAQDYLGWLGGRYSIVAFNNGKKVALDVWDNVKEKECSNSKYAKLTSYNSKYYKLTYNIPVLSKLDVDGKAVKINTSKKYRLVHGTDITGLGTKQKNIYVYMDDCKITSGSKTLGRITFDKKDYRFSDGSHKDKIISCKVTTIK